MKRIITAALVLMAASSYAAEPGMLDKMKSDIVKNEINKCLSTAPQIKTEKETDKHKSDGKISVSLSYKDCVAQGNTADECMTLTKDNPTGLDKYDLKDPKFPSLTDSAENIFIYLHLRH